MDVMGPLIFLLPALSGPALAAGREFHLVDLPKTWSEARSYCRDRFIDLATLESAEELARVRGMVVNSGHQKAWLGLYDDEWSWKWSLDNSSLYERVSGPWFVFITDNFLSRQHCANLLNGSLGDFDCGAPLPSVCYDDFNHAVWTCVHEPTNTFVVVSEAKSWPSAQTYCRQLYTGLASITNQQQFHAIMSVVNQSQSLWVGLFRDSWKWSDHSDSSFREWAPGFPTGYHVFCGVAGVEGLRDSPCYEKLPFICSAPQRKVLKVTLKTDGSVNLNNPLVQEAILRQMEEALRGQGVNDFRLRWRKQLHEDAFNVTQ